ncbi:hypothetical protein P8452_21113 [Trifolium repens]|nr:hypothetical protein P8452_21113 [Trifolium repens]
MLEEMGKTIVFQESPNDPGRRSRLWSLEDIDKVLRKNKGTEIVQGIFLKSSPYTLYEAHWDPEAFSKMGNLRRACTFTMINSKLKQLWNRNEYFGKLKVIDLSNSKDLRKLQTSLEFQILKSCILMIVQNLLKFTNLSDNTKNS